MTSKRRWILMLTASAIGVFVALKVAGPLLQRSAVYPEPRGLPPVVSETTEQLLEQLQAALERKAPAVVQALRPGLSAEQIAGLETAGGFRLSDDLRAIYRWHDGMVANAAVSLLPGHRFLPLQDVVNERTLIAKQAGAATLAQQAAFEAFAGHRKQWLHVLDDGAGDGYFYDSNRTDAEGAFFFHFAEDGHYRWFPSFRNFLSGLVECYETGSIKTGADGQSVDEDFERTEQIWGD